MSGIFVELAARLQRPPRWIAFERYAAAVFAGNPADWHTNGQRHADALLQAQRQVGSDVLAVAVLDAWLHDADWCAAAQVSPIDALAACLADGPPQRFVGEVMDALFHRLAERTLLVLALPSPAQLLHRIGRAPPFDFADLDDIASGLTALLRRHSPRAFGALALHSDDPAGLSDDELDACGPLLKSARYYGWGTALRLDGVPEGTALQAQGFDALLLGHWSEAALDAGALRQAAGGLGGAFWHGAAKPLHRPGLRYGEIPPDAVPEAVAATLRIVHDQ